MVYYSRDIMVQRNRTYHFHRNKKPTLKTWVCVCCSDCGRFIEKLRHKYCKACFYKKHRYGHPESRIAYRKEYYRINKK